MRDKGSNVILAVDILLRIFTGVSLDCVAHGLQNLIYADMKFGDEGTLARLNLLKKICKIYKRLSYKLNDIDKEANNVQTLSALSRLSELVDEQDDFDSIHDINTLISPNNETLELENKIRWTSLHAMLDSFKKRQETIDSMLFRLKERDLMLSVTEMLHVLGNFKEASTSLQASFYGFARLPQHYVGICVGFPDAEIVGASTKQVGRYRLAHLCSSLISGYERNCALPNRN